MNQINAIAYLIKIQVYIFMINKKVLVNLVQLAVYVIKVDVIFVIYLLKGI
jgi:hypothetical protein